MSESFDISRLLVLRKVTKALAELVGQEIKDYLSRFKTAVNLCLFCACTKMRRDKAIVQILKSCIRRRFL